MAAAVDSVQQRGRSTKDRKKFLLHYLCEFPDRLDFVKILVDECSFNVNKADDVKDTPLHKATRAGNLELCQYLVTKDSSVNAKNKNNETPLSIAKNLKSQEVYFLLLEKHIESVIYKKSKPAKQRSASVDVPTFERSTSSSSCEISRLIHSGPDKRIGCGAFGIVYKLPIEGNHLVAVKELPLSASEDGRNNVRFEFGKASEEISIGKSLKHENIIRLLTYVIDSDRLYLIMEFAALGSLSERIYSDEYLTPRQIKLFQIQLFQCLEYLQEMKVIHRDIKPQNILVVAEDRIKLGDFGVAKSVETLGLKTHSKQGTEDYMAPELFQRSLHYNHKVDVWSAGLVFFEMRTRERPRRDMSTNDFVQIMKDKECSDVEINIVVACNQTKSEDRWEARQILEMSDYFKPKLSNDSTLIKTRDLEGIDPADLDVVYRTEGYELVQGKLKAESKSGERLPSPILLLLASSSTPLVKIFNADIQEIGELKLEVQRDADINNLCVWESLNSIPAVLVSDNHHHIIHCCHLDGQHMESSDEDMFKDCVIVSMSVLPQDRLGVCRSDAQHSVSILSLPQLENLSQLANDNIPEHPKCLAASGTSVFIGGYTPVQPGNSFNTLSQGNRIQALSLEDAGYLHNSSGNFTSPCKIVHYFGSVFVCDNFSHRLHQLSESLAPIAQVGGMGTEPHQLSSPSGFACFKTSGGLHFVVISDTANRRLVLYQLE